MQLLWEQTDFDFTAGQCPASDANSACQIPIGHYTLSDGDVEGETRFKFESGKVRIHTQNTSQSHLYCFRKDTRFLKSGCILRSPTCVPPKSSCRRTLFESRSGPHGQHAAPNCPMKLNLMFRHALFVSRAKQVVPIRFNLIMANTYCVCQRRDAICYRHSEPTVAGVSRDTAWLQRLVSGLSKRRAPFQCSKLNCRVINHCLQKMSVRLVLPHRCHETKTFTYIYIFFAM